MRSIPFHQCYLPTMGHRFTPADIPQPKSYVLDKNGTPVPEPDLAKFGKFIVSEAKFVKQDVLPGEIMVSTVFSGVDYLSPPRLWETAIFGGPHNGYEQRYTSREAALAGHEKALTLASGKQR